MKKSLAESNKKALELEAKVERLKTEVSKAKNISIIKFKESEAYKSTLIETTPSFLLKRRTR